MMLPLVVLLHCYALVYAGTEAETANTSENESSSESKRSLDNPPQMDLCETNQDINEECKICEMLNGPQEGSCCTDPDALLWCHLEIQEVEREIEGSSEEEENYEDSNEVEEAIKRSSEENAMDKRYGSVFSNWQWYSHRNGRRLDNNIAKAKRAMDKRYGNLFGSLFADRKLNKNKRYGMVFGRLFTQDRNKRYGNLMGRLFGRHSDDKREGSLRKRYGSLFSSKDKRYGSLFRPLFSESKRYGSLMGRIYGAPKSNDDKRSMELEKRYGSLMGRPFSSKKKIGRR